MCTGYQDPRPTDMKALMGRRGFLKGVGGAVALGATGAFTGAAAAATTERVSPRQISIQLYTLRELMNEDLEGVFAALRDIGYRKVEHAGFHGRSAKQFKAALDKHGLRSTSGHQGIPYPYDRAAWQQTINDALVLGQRRIVVPAGPPVSSSGFFSNRDPDSMTPPTRAEFTEYAHALNQAGAVAHRNGMRLGYHNHNWEFLPMADDPLSTGYEVLLEETDPELVHFEMDIYWVWKAEQDPVPVLRAHRSRFQQFHVKDMDEEGNFEDPGKGVINFARVFRAAGVRMNEYIVERDDAGQDALRTAQIGYRYLSRIDF